MSSVFFPQNAGRRATLYTHTRVRGILGISVNIEDPDVTSPGTFEPGLTRPARSRLCGPLIAPPPFPPSGLFLNYYS